MKTNLGLVVWISVITSFALYTGCEESQKAEPEQLPSPQFELGHKAAKVYMAEQLADYRIVIILHEVGPGGRDEFLSGFKAAFTEAGRRADGVKYSEILRTSVTGDQFERAQGMGSKHAQRLVTNAQIQNLIRSSLGVSGGVTLGWKAGYIQGFKTRKFHDTLQEGKGVDEEQEEQFYKEAGAAYNALRAAVGQ
jgi:hypothetical protein